jgi:hypothetical protein
MSRNKKEEIIEYTKELYLTPDEEGNHRYSLREIEAEISQKFHKNFTYRTIANWAKKYGWDKLWEEGVRYGITEAIAKQESNKTKEEQFREAISKVIRDKTTMNINLMKLAYKFILENGFSNVEEARRVYETASKDLQIIEYSKKIDEKEARNIYDDPIWDELEDNPEIRTIIIKTLKKYEK